MNKIIILILIAIFAFNANCQVNRFDNLQIQPLKGNIPYSEELEKHAKDDKSSEDVRGAYQAILGSFYDRGEGVRQDKTKALKLFQESAKAGNPIGQYNLGVYYLRGEVLPKNLMEADNLADEIIYKTTLGKHERVLGYLLKLNIYGGAGYGINNNPEQYFQALSELVYFERDNHLAETEVYFEMGRCLTEGIGTEINEEFATGWFEAALKIDPENNIAKIWLATILDSKTNPSKDYAKALKLWEEMAGQGVEEAALTAGQNYLIGKGTTKDISKAYEYFKPLADRGDVNGVQGLIHCLLQLGYYTEAKRYLEDAYKNGGMNLFSCFGDTYYHGNEFFQPSHEIAFNVCLWGSEKEGSTSLPCKFYLSLMYHSGDGCKQDIKKSNTIMHDLSNKDYGPALCLLGTFFYDEGDNEEAFSMLSKAYNQLNLMSMNVKAVICHKLSVCYEFGRGVKENPQRAETLRTEAKSYGYTPESEEEYNKRVRRTWGVVTWE